MAYTFLTAQAFLPFSNPSFQPEDLCQKAIFVLANTLYISAIELHNVGGIQAKLTILFLATTRVKQLYRNLSMPDTLFAAQ